MIYGHYNDDNGSAEFVHIQDGSCTEIIGSMILKLIQMKGAIPSLMIGQMLRCMLMEIYCSRATV